LKTQVQKPKFKTQFKRPSSKPKLKRPSSKPKLKTQVQKPKFKTQVQKSKFKTQVQKTKFKSPSLFSNAYVLLNNFEPLSKILKYHIFSQGGLISPSPETKSGRSSHFDYPQLLIQ
jgi:hypothetical protein